MEKKYIQNIFISDFVKEIEFLTQTQNKSWKYDGLMFDI